MRMKGFAWSNIDFIVQNYLGGNNLSLICAHLRFQLHSANTVFRYLEHCCSILWLLKPKFLGTECEDTLGVSPWSSVF